MVTNDRILFYVGVLLTFLAGFATGILLHPLPAKAEEPVKTCTIMWAGLAGSGASPGLYVLAHELNRLPNSHARVVEPFTDAKFDHDCKIRIVIGHSIGVSRAITATEEQHVDLLVSFDGMGFDFARRSRARRNLYFLACTPGGYHPAGRRAVRSPYWHVGIDSDLRLRKLVVAKVRSLQ